MLSDARLIEREIFTAQETVAGDHVKYPLVDEDTLTYMDSEFAADENHTYVFCYVRYGENITAPFIDIYVYGLMLYPYVSKRLIIQKDHMMSEEDESLFFEVLDDHDTVFSCFEKSDGYSRFCVQLAQYDPDYKLKMVHVCSIFGSKLLKDLYFTSHRGPREILCKAQLSNIAFNLDLIDCNLLGSTPSDIVWPEYCPPLLLLRILNKDRLVNKLFNEEDFRMALEVFGEYRTFFSKYKLPTSAQWNYLDILYFSDKGKGYCFNKAVYKRLQDSEEDGNLGMAYLKYEEYIRRWSEWLGLKKIPPADEIRNLVRSLEEVEYSIPDYEIQDGFAYYRKEYEKYSFSSDDEEFIISPPMDTRDFAAEAFRQNNCLWDNYFEDYLSGYSIILFIRKKDSPSVPYVTMEINSEEILQVYGKNNAFPDAYVYRFLEKYAKKMKLAYDPEELTSDGPGKWISKDKECECRAYFQELKFRSIHEAASTNGRYSASECKGQLSIYDCFDFLVADAR